MTDGIRTAYAIQFHRDDVYATWEGRKPVLLKEHPRWSVGPVSEISVPDDGKDGH